VKKISAILIVAVITSCRWRDASDFQRELRCGMTPTDVDRIAKRRGATVQALPQGHRSATHQLKRGRTVILFNFDRVGLRTVQIAEVTGLTGFKTSPQQNLCSGELTHSVDVEVSFSPEWVGASVFIDGQKRVVIPSADFVLRITMTSGSHELKLSKSDGRVLVELITVPPTQARVSVTVMSNSFAVSTKPL
jgi:hypothetical protein